MRLSPETKPFPYNGRAKSSLGDVVGRLDILPIDKSPEGRLNGEQLATGAYSFSPGRLFLTADGIASRLFYSNHIWVVKLMVDKMQDSYETYSGLA